MRGWLFVALVLAALLHWWMYHYFSNVSLIAAENAHQKNVPRERIAIDPRVLQEKPAVQEIPDIIAEPLQEKAPDIKANLEEIVDLLPDDKEIDLTPEVNQVTNFSKKDDGLSKMAAQAPALAAIVESIPTDDAKVAEAANALKSSLLQKAVSSNQLTIPTKALDQQLEGMNDALLDQLTKTAEAGNGMEKREGFSSLDDLLSGGKSLTASTDPILLPTDLLFEYGSDQLAEGARLSLMKLGYLIQRNPNHRFIIEGHTDSYGSDSFNLDLSQRRANAVVSWLVDSLKLSTERVQAVGRGRSALIKFGGSVEEQAINRRVEIKVRPL